MRKLRSLLAVAAIVFSASAVAASLADRSPFVQGHWWNRDRSGNGFDVFNAAGQVAVVWYTYDESSRPIWYIAQGSLATLGTQAWPLTQQSWSNGRPGAASTVGSIKVEVVDPETLRMTWDVRGHTGQWNIVPLISSGIESEVDHSGHWFDPAQSGWGFNLSEQGDALGTVIYAYDTAGAPTWVAGFGRDAAKGTVNVFATTGSCPWCNYVPTNTRPVGTVAFEYRAEADLVVHSSLNFAFAPGVGVDGAHAMQLSRPASTRPADRQLASFDSPAALKAYLDAGMMNVPVPAAVDFSPAPPSASVPFSPTNLQEQGVDEADLVKSDGRRAYAFAHDTNGMRTPTIRVASIGTDGSSLSVLGSVALATGAATPVAQAGLYLDGNLLVSIASTQPISPASSAWALTSAWTQGTTSVEILDVSSATGPPMTTWRAQIDGHLVASRRIGDKLYLVTRSVPYIAGFQYGVFPPQIFPSNNRALLAATPVEAMLPRVRLNGGAPTLLVSPAGLFAPPQGSAVPVPDIVVVTTVDLAKPALAQTFGVIGGVEAIYMSPTNLYLGTRRNQIRTSTGAIVSTASPTAVTDIHQLALGDTIGITGSATVEGFLATDLDKAPFRMSEANGRLRVVTSTTSAMGWGFRGQANTLTILQPSTVAPGLLKTVSQLPNASRPQPLGLPFEELYATRYVGDRLYAVTFTAAGAGAPFVDPLYAIDLANAADPRILGDVVIPGFSDYLHPLADGKLLGFGRVVTAQGVQQGLQLSLFDVAADGSPRVIQQLAIGKRGSDSALLHDHHALSVLVRPDGYVNIAFPARIHDDTVAFGSGDTAMYSWKQSGLMRYEVRSGGSGLDSFGPFITEQMPQAAPVNDAATSNARAIQLPLGTVYVANGRFWLQSNLGGATGPL